MHKFADENDFKITWKIILDSDDKNVSEIPVKTIPSNLTRFLKALFGSKNPIDLEIFEEFFVNFMPICIYITPDLNNISLHSEF